MAKLSYAVEVDYQSQTFLSALCSTQEFAAHVADCAVALPDVSEARVFTGYNSKKKRVRTYTATPSVQTPSEQPSTPEVPFGG